MAPFPLRPRAVNLPAPLTADPAAQQPLAQAVDVHDHGLVGFLYLRNRVRFQPQLFSDKSLYEHLGLSPSLCFGEQLRRIESRRGAPQEPINGISAQSKDFKHNYTFWRGAEFWRRPPLLYKGVGPIGSLDYPFQKSRFAASLLHRDERTRPQSIP